MRISLSTNGGSTFGTVLAASTPNDGSEKLTMPDVTANSVRIKIEAVDNYFFDVNDAPFALGTTQPPRPPAVAPETTITLGPSDGSILLAKGKTFGFVSSVTPATFVCTLDGEVVGCRNGFATVTIRPGTHVFGVAAVSALPA